MEDFRDFLFGYHWDPNEHIPRGFGLLTIFYKKIPHIYTYMMKNLKRKIFVAGGYLRFFIWLLLGPQ